MKIFLTGLALCLLLGAGVPAQQNDGSNGRHDQQDQQPNRQPDQNREQHPSDRQGRPPSTDHRTPQAQAPPQNQQQPRNQQSEARAQNGARPQNENRPARNQAPESNHQNRQAVQPPKNQNDNRAQQGRSIEHGAQQGEQRQRYSQQPDQARGRDQNGHYSDRGRPSEQHGYASQRGNSAQIWQHARAQNWRSQHRTWQQRGGYHGYRVPSNRFSLFFGRGHEFRINAFPLFLAGGYPRFQYHGYWVNLLDPIPEYWAPNWFDTDEVFIDYSGDGYYLYDTRYPDDRIAVDLSVQ